MAFSTSVAPSLNSSFPFLQDLQRSESPHRVRMPEAVPKVAPTNAAVEKKIILELGQDTRTEETCESTTLKEDKKGVVEK